MVAPRKQKRLVHPLFLAQLRQRCICNGQRFVPHRGLIVGPTLAYLPGNAFRWGKLAL
jgi:hypothetical protein